MFSKNKNLSLYILIIFLISCTPVNQESNVADQKQENWCIGKLNQMITKYSDRVAEGTNSYFTGLRSAEQILLNEKGLDIYTKDIPTIYANGDKTLFTNSIKVPFEESTGVSAGEIWTVQEYINLIKFLIIEDNEDALRVCKIWEELSY
jgi:hypothetical protein